jgi:hypothetical protein
MYLTDIKAQLIRAVELIEEYEQSGHSIDRDVALDIIRRAYEDLKFCGDEQLLVNDAVLPILPTPTVDEPEVEVEIVMAEQDETEDEEAVEESVEPEVAVQEPEPEISEVEHESVVGLEPEVEITPKIESLPEPAPEVESEVKPVEVVAEPTPVVEEVVDSEIVPEPSVEPEPEPEPKRVVVEPSLFGDDDTWSRPAPSRRRIRSLYGDDSATEHKPRIRRKAAEPKVEPAVEADSVVAPKVEIVADVEPPQVLADTISTTPVIADTIPAQPSVGESGAVNSLRGAISVGDRFMLIRELFGGDQAQYDTAIETLDSFDNLDDCIIYIAENFTWRASSDGAKLVMELLQRKLS